MILLASLATALSCWLWLGPVPLGRLRARTVGARRRRLRRGVGPVVVGLWLAGAIAAGGLLAGGTGAVVAPAVALPVLTAVHLWRRHQARSAAATEAREVVGACQLLAGLLRVGHVPAAALRLAARDAPVLAEAAALQEVGGPVGPALRRSGLLPGRRGLVELGIAWEVAERTGASLTATLDALAERLAARQAVGDVVAAELSAPRATGRLLGVLPVAGVLLGYSFGGDPLGFLTGSTPGRVSLFLGVSLGCAGVLWTERITDEGGG